MLFLWTVRPTPFFILKLEIQEKWADTVRGWKKNFGGKGLELPGTSFTISHIGSNF